MYCMRVVRLKSNNRTESRVNDSCLYTYVRKMHFILEQLRVVHALYRRAVADLL